MTTKDPNWFSFHKCGLKEPCWEAEETDDPYEIYCKNCKQEWPKCVSKDGLACLFESADMLSDSECERLLAECRRRGLE